jgi:hypothetical protein
MWIVKFGPEPVKQWLIPGSSDLDQHNLNGPAPFITITSISNPAGKSAKQVSMCLAFKSAEGQEIMYCLFIATIESQELDNGDIFALRQNESDGQAS